MGNCSCITSTTPKEKNFVNVDNLEEACIKQESPVQVDKKTPRGHNPLQVEMKKSTSPSPKPQSLISFHNENQIKNSVLTLGNISFVNSPNENLRRSIEVIQRMNKKQCNTREINVMLLGAETAGKSSFVIKIIDDKFESFYIVTLGVENFKRKFTFNQKDYTINFIITSGSLEYKTDYTDKYKQMDFFLVFYDVTNLKSFEKAKLIVSQELSNYSCKYKDEDSNIFLIGNKIDLKEKRVNIKDVESYCNSNRIKHFQISVKLNLNLSKVINTILEIFDSIMET